MAWGGLGDREVVRRAAAEFDVLLTVDRSLEFQQNLPATLSLITVISKSIEFNYLRSFVPQILEALDRLRPGDRIRITEPRQSR
jgi:hypothetical protein